MKKVLILVLSSDFEPYSKMIQTSLQTWDSIDVENCETIFYCGSAEKPSSDKIIYLNVGNGLFDMGMKTLLAYEWALNNKEFDYIARVNASCYVDKKELIKHIQALPETNLISGIEADSQNGFKYLWGGTQYILSKDVVEKIVANKELWNHKFMEDESVSLLVRELGIPFHNGKACSIDNLIVCWRCMIYGGEESFEFTNFKEILNHPRQFFYRVKQDLQRHLDEYLMRELFKGLN